MGRKTPNKTQTEVPTHQQTLLHCYPNSLFQFIINKFPAFENPLEIYQIYFSSRVTVCASHSFLPKLVKDVRQQHQPSVQNLIFPTSALMLPEKSVLILCSCLGSGEQKIKAKKTPKPAWGKNPQKTQTNTLPSNF